MTFSLLGKASINELHLEPFPHLVIENALPSDYYKKINDNFPLEYFKTLENDQDNNSRKDLMIKDFNNQNINISKIWKNFIHFHSSEEFYLQVLNLFKESIINIYPNLFKNYEDLLTIKNINHLSTSVNTPVKTLSSVRDAHLDKLNKLFTGLFYLRSDNDKSIGGDLNLYTWKKKISKKQKRQYSSNNVIPNDAVQLFKTIEYKANTFVIFLNSLDSLHGVSPRSITNEYRKMCVFTSILPFSIDKRNIFERAYLKLFNLFK